jgi:carbamoyl-phosphate synthase large subunit
MNNYSILWTPLQVSRLSRIDNWFLSRLRNIASMKAEASRCTLDQLNGDALKTLKCGGFSDRQIARYTGCTELVVRRKRQQLGVTPFCKQIDTLAAEFPAETNYLYMTYHGDEHDVTADSEEVRNKESMISSYGKSSASSSSAAMSASGGQGGGVMVLGCGAYCIGSSVEFDWCAVSAVRQLRAMGDRAIVVNYNPETVSTDYDESDKLYFEELTLERVLDIYELERSAGIVVSVGGQIPNNLALPLHQQGARILGTCPDSIDKAEDRHKFSALLDKIKVDQPQWKELTTRKDAYDFANLVGYPVLVRPSFVLSGAAMSVASNETMLTKCLQEAEDVSPDKPVVMSKFILNAKEIEFDAVAQEGHVLNYAISEHVENAGVHSGDATLVLPAQKLYVQTVRQVKQIASQIALALNISGPFNIQFLAKDNMVKVIECNLRASRTFPFISKTFDVNFITLATKVMLGYPCKPYSINLYDYDYVAVKAPMFSFTRLRGADPTLGVEMSSTGEVACFGSDVQEAFLQALLASNFNFPQKLPDKYILVSIAEESMRAEFLLSMQLLHEMGFNLACTPGTAEYYQQQNIPVTVLEKPVPQDVEGNGSDMNVLKWIESKAVDLVINIPEGTTRNEEISAGYLMRRRAVDFGTSLLTNIKCAALFCEALHRAKPLPCKSSEEYIGLAQVGWTPQGTYYWLPFVLFFCKLSSISLLFLHKSLSSPGTYAVMHMTI